MAVQPRAVASRLLPQTSLHGRLRSLQEEAVALWRDTPCSLPDFGPTHTWRTRWTHARATARLIDAIASRVEAYPPDALSREAWKRGICEQLQREGEIHFGWPAGYRRLLFGDAFFDAAVDFARQARAFDPALAIEDLWQALRNVWIGNSLQMLLGRPVALTPGLFAYSMLYPVTDNLLDASDVEPEHRREFAVRVGRRLHGERFPTAHQCETHTFDLIERLERVFPRGACHDVWASLFAIHHGQLASLRQQQSTPLSERDLLELSVSKGGASVLADLYLVAGAASPDEERFAFRYGVFLQLLDDLQDVQADLSAHHQTLFTHAARTGLLDHATSRLARFIDIVLDSAPAMGARERGDCLDLIRRNCRALLVGVVAERTDRFTRGFRRSLERQWPLGLSAMRRLRRRALRRFDATSQRLRARFGATPLELLLEGPPEGGPHVRGVRL